ncbi:MAG: recombination mediator RecR [Leptospiraceae bacterium]|nr:recombination mediator RecR [Leptospiraceae bacterium]MDW7976035.1 recombination mediator RecR [Leptospiraceae bacterium]
MYFKELDSFIRSFTKLPGIGEKSARRIAFFLLKSDKQLAHELSQNIKQLVERIHFCKTCGGFTTSEICDICSDPTRNAELLCVVEEPSDIFLIENTGEFRGYYHVLMGALSPIDGVGIEDLRFKELEARLQLGVIKECFIATNPTLEGDATADYIVRSFKKYPVKFTRLSHGVLTGSSLEFSDKYTLSLSIRNRRPLIGA